MKKTPLPNQNGQPWKNQPRPWHDSGFYRTIDIESLDNRTTIGKSVHDLKATLRQFIGSHSVLGELLISRIVYKVIKLSLYEAQCLQDPQNIEAQHYLPMANSLRLDLDALAKLAGQTRPPSLEDYLNGLQEAGK